MIVGRTVYLRG